MVKQEIVKQTFEDTITKLIDSEHIKQMFDAGCFKIEKIIDEQSNIVFIRVNALIENQLNLKGTT